MKIYIACNGKIIKDFGKELSIDKIWNYYTECQVYNENALLYCNGKLFTKQIISIL